MHIICQFRFFIHDVGQLHIQNNKHNCAVRTTCNIQIILSPTLAPSFPDHQCEPSFLRVPSCRLATGLTQPYRLSARRRARSALTGRTNTPRCIVSTRCGASIAIDTAGEEDARGVAGGAAARIDLCPCDTGEDDERELELDLHRSRCCWGVNL